MQATGLRYPKSPPLDHCQWVKYDDIFLDFIQGEFIDVQLVASISPPSPFGDGGLRRPSALFLRSGDVDGVRPGQVVGHAVGKNFQMIQPLPALGKMAGSLTAVDEKYIDLMQ